MALAVEAYQIRERQADARAGVVAAILANAHRDRKKRRKPYQPSDFFPSLRSGRRVMTPEQQLRIVELLNAALGGQDLRQR